MGPGHPRNFSIEIELSLPEWRIATYGFEIASRRRGAFEVKEERLQVLDRDGTEKASYRRTRGEEVEASVRAAPPVLEDRLYLVNAAGLPEYRPVYDALVSMGYYSLSPKAIRELQSPDAGELLHNDGGNIASVVARLKSEQPDLHLLRAVDLEASRSGKRWVERHLARYSETADQPSLTARMDLQACRERSASFDKLCRELEARR